MADHYIKFSFIALCFLITLGSYRFCISKKDWAYLTAALGMTLVSDFFLVLAGNYPAGVFTFCFVHISYILRVTRINHTERKRNLIRIGITVLCGCFIYTFLYVVLTQTAVFPGTNLFQPLLILAGVYAALFLQNLIAHIKYYRDNGPDSLPLINRRIMLLGLILFALCDIHVMLFNLPNFLPVPERIGLWGLRWIWIYYAPSQLLLSISAVRWK